MRPIKVIAREIFADWDQARSGVSPFAKPHLEAMLCLDKIEDRYGVESGKSIVIYFLCNSATWRGPVARRIKAELKEICK